jgi:hypothetical protein
MAQLAFYRRAAGGLAVALLTVGCAAGPSPVPTTATTPAAIATSAATPGATTTPIATTAGTPAPTGWHAAPIQSWFATVQFSDVIWTGSRFVATVSGPGDGGSFADSTDGIDWRLQAQDDATWRPEQLASGPSGIVAVGTIAGTLASWYSADGLAWTPSPKGLPLPSLGDDTAYVGDVTPRGSGWLAVGRREPACNLDCGSNPSRAYVWTSPDGLAWTRVADQASLKGGGMAAVTSLVNGLVAVGVASAHPAVWASSDGAAWTRLADDPALREVASPNGTLPSAATGVAVVDVDTVVVVGSAYAQDSCAPGVKAELCPGARAWWSTDGKTWTRAPIDLPIDGQIFGVAPAPAGLLAVGPSGACLGGIWSSTDGTAWTCEATDPAFSGFGPYAAAASSTIEVAVGLTSAGQTSGSGLPGSVWVRALP